MTNKGDVQTNPKANTKATKPWYKKWWVWVIAAVLVAGIIGSVLDEDTPQSEVTADAPDQVGSNLKTAVTTLEHAGYKVDTVSDDGKNIIDKSNWTVTSQSQNGNDVLLEATKQQDEPDDMPDEEVAKEPKPSEEQPKEEPKKEPSPRDQETTQGLSGSGAAIECGNVWQTALKNEFPASKVKIHSIIGVLSQKYQEDSDSWFIKIEGSIDKNTINVECEVTGSETNAHVELIAVY